MRPKGNVEALFSFSPPRGGKGEDSPIESLTGREASTDPSIPPISIAGFMHPTNQRTPREEAVASLLVKLSLVHPFASEVVPPDSHLWF